MDKSSMVESLVKHYSNGSKAAFAERLGVKPQTIHSWISRSTFDSELIFAKCDLVSPEWLLTGQGEMLRKVPAVASFDYSIQRNQPEVKTINTPKTKEPTEELQYIPYYSFEATAGVIELVDTSAEYEIGKIVVPNMPKCDGAVAVTGDSMYPLLKSGDIVAFKLVHDINNIHYGDMYLISLNEDGDCYITVKWLQKHPSDPSKAILVSHNEHYAPREVELRHIHRLALIKLSIRYNSMG